MNIPRPEYPRPRLVRDAWQNLNGEWDFCFDFGDSGKDRKFWKKDNYPFDRKITVPYVPESPLSRIEYVDFFPACWYRRSFTADISRGGRILLHVGAADFLCEVWVNESYAGSHKGGYTPFKLDITELVKSEGNELVVRCFDNGRDSLQYTGKQIYSSYYNSGCDYTRCTGIWQTVWLEYVPASYIDNVKLTPDVDNEKVDVCLRLVNTAPADSSVKASVSFGGKAVAEVVARVTGNACSFSVPVADPILWDLGKGNLYDMTVTYGDDTVKTYFGMRKVELCGNRFLLNGRSVFQRLVLDQGYYPDGIYTAATKEDIERDIKLSQNLGFNGARLHMKVFEPYALYYADLHGYMLWGEFPNWGMNIMDRGASQAMTRAWLEELERDYNSPAVIGWCPLNETWEGANRELFSTLYFVTKAYDPYRPFIDASGFVHGDHYDIFDVHDYEQNPAAFAENYKYFITGNGSPKVNFADRVSYDGKKPYFVSEMGGIKWDIDHAKHAAEGADSWGYGDAPKTLEEFYDRFEGLMNALLDNPGICALCYTQLTDVYQEMNGLYAFDRREKFDAERIRAIVSRKAAIED